MKGTFHMVLQRWAIIVLAINCCTANLMGWGESFVPAFSGWTEIPYQNKAINEASIEIQKYIDIPTKEAAERVGTETDVRQEFKENFLTDAANDAPVSAKRKRQRIMTLIRTANQNKEISDLMFEVTELRENTALKLLNKEEALQAEIDGLWGSQLGWGTCTVVGGIVVLMATQISGERNMPIKLGVGLTGTVMTMGGGAKLYSVVGKKRLLETDIQIKKQMKQDWQEAFKVR
jgi:hypothetical protein